MVSQSVLLFGDFTLKSGRQAPYFFNLGNVSHGSGLAELGRYYAQCILDNDLRPDVLYGPAYKGIPLVSVTAVALAEQHVDVGIAYNRKEVKRHGEQGVLVGADMTNKRVVVIDDVVVDGASKVEAIELIRNVGGIVAGIVIAIDRNEYVNANQTAAEVLASTLHTRVHSVVSIFDVLDYFSTTANNQEQREIVSDYIASNCKPA